MLVGCETEFNLINITSYSGMIGIRRLSILNIKQLKVVLATILSRVRIYEQYTCSLLDPPLPQYIHALLIVTSFLYVCLVDFNPILRRYTRKKYYLHYPSRLFNIFAYSRIDLLELT